MAGAIFGELGRCFQSLETLVLSDGRHFWILRLVRSRGRRNTSDASGSLSWQAKYFRDFCEKVAGTEAIHRLSHFRLWPARYMVKFEARATFPSLCACWIALIAAWSAFLLLSLVGFSEVLVKRSCKVLYKVLLSRTCRILLQVLVCRFMTKIL